MPSEEEYYQQQEYNCKEEAKKRKKSNGSNKSKPLPPENSLLVFSHTNCVRLWCHWLCNHSYFGQ